MATNKPIQSVVVTSAVSSITFSGIDQNYTDLVIMADFTISTANASVFMRFNGDTSSAYSDTTMSATGSLLYTDRDSSATQIRVSAQRTAQTATDRQHFTIHVNDYANTTNYKTCLSRYGSIGGVEGYAGQWRNTSAINSITLGFASSYTFSPGTIVSLYGIKSGAPQAFGGDSVFTDNTYWYHVFRTTGSFTMEAQKPISADVLVIAGGGGATEQPGGGAGGVIFQASKQIAGRYTVIVGAGGAGTNHTAAPTKGADSFFGAMKAFGGGAGYNSPLNIGGSGGGSYNTQSDFGTTNQTSNDGGTGYGNNGGNGAGGSVNYRGGGGGGAGQAGFANNNPAGGAFSIGGYGGNGLNTWSSWASATGTGVDGYYAGGGGSGAVDNLAGNGGLGGGGNGGQSGTSMSVYPKKFATSGATNTGSGGGGGGWSGDGYSLGGNGGSGIVIVRYPV